MRTSYIHAAMRHSAYTAYKDGSFFATIPGFPGVWEHAGTVEECREELRAVLKDWLLLSIADRDVLPASDSMIASSRGA